MKQLQVVSQLVNDLASVTATKDCSSGPCVWVDRLCSSGATKLAGVFDLQQQEANTIEKLAGHGDENKCTKVL